MVSIWYHLHTNIFIRYCGMYIWTGLIFIFDFMMTLIDD